MKRCTSCQQDKPRDSFGVDRSRLDGLTYACRTCRNAQRRKAYAPKPPAVRDSRCSRCGVEKTGANCRRQAGTFDGFATHCRSCHQDYQRANAAAHAQRTTAYRKRNPKATRRRARIHDARYRAANPDAIRAKSARRRALRVRATVEHVHPLVVLERDDGQCGICGGDVDPQDFHVDHIDALANGGEHSYANVQTAHPSCNVRKGTR